MLKTSGRTIVVVAAHPDDEVLGCGGTIARHAAEGDTVHILFMADGETARKPEHGAASIAMRNKAALDAAKILGAKPPVCLGLPDNQMDSLPLLEIVQTLEKALLPLKPEIIYTHNGSDLNVDHRLTHQAVLTACRPLPGSTVQAIYAFEVLSATEWAGPATGPAFTPTHFVDIEPTITQKIHALAAYEAEMRPFPHSRSLVNVQALATFRGGCVGLGAAEGFVVVRSLA